MCQVQLESSLLQMHCLTWKWRKRSRHALQHQRYLRRRILANQPIKLERLQRRKRPMRFTIKPQLCHQGLSMGRKHLEILEHPLSLWMLIIYNNLSLETFIYFKTKIHLKQKITFVQFKLLKRTSTSNASHWNSFCSMMKMSSTMNIFVCFGPFFTLIYSISLLLWNHLFVSCWTFWTWGRTWFTRTRASSSPSLICFSIVPVTWPLSVDQ